MTSMGPLDSIWQDLRHGARLLRRNPAFAIVAILSLALGVGANTAIFELLDALRMRTLPVPHAGQLAEVRIAGDNGRDGWVNGPHPILTNPLWERIRDRQEAFSGVFAWSSPVFELSTGGESRRAQGLWVSGDFFRTLDVHPLIGRAITVADDTSGCATPPAVISYAFWQRNYGGSPSAVGRPLTIDGHPFDIVGVTPPEFFGVEVGRSFDVAVPLCAVPYSLGAGVLDRKDAWFLGVMGRLKPDWSIERATAQLDALSPAMVAETVPAYRPEDAKRYLGFRLAARDIHPAAVVSMRTMESQVTDSLLRERLMATLSGFFGGVAALLATIGLYGVMAYTVARRRNEIGIRMALGASRGDVMRMVLREAGLLLASGTAVGLLLAVAAARGAESLLFGLRPGDPATLTIAAGGLGLVAMAASCLPALRASRLEPTEALREE